MARNRPSPREIYEAQAAADRARVDRDTAAADRQLLRARASGDAEADRIAELQRSLGIARFDDPLFELRRSFLAGVARIDAEIDIIVTERWLNTATSKGRVNEERARDRLKKRKAELGKVEPPPPKPGEQPPEITRALAVLKRRGPMILGLALAP